MDQGRTGIGTAKMHRIIRTTALLCVVILLGSAAHLHASPATNDQQTLVSINGKKHSVADFKTWWRNWREKGMLFPENPDSFIDWQLLAKEAHNMNLGKVPRVRSKIDTFLKVRSIMRLKYTEVDSKIIIPEKAIRKIYQEEYSPRRNFQFFYYKTKEPATIAHKEINQGLVVIEDLQKKPATDGGPDFFQEKWLRPRDINPEWSSITEKIKEREITEPFPYKDGFLILRLKNVQKDNSEDYQKKKKTIKQKLWKQQKAELTTKLIKKLRKKYNVKINQKIMDNLDVANIPEELAGQDILTSTAMKLSVKQLAKKILAEKDLRARMGFKPMDQKQFNSMILSNIITQTLINHEALNRHYEKTPPIKNTYDFYCNHRLIIELEYQLFKKASKDIGDDEILAYYNDNLSEFSTQATVTYAEAKGEEGKIKKIWLGVLTGEDFDDIVLEHLGKKPQTKTIPIDQLDPSLKDMIKSLAINEVCSPFKSGAQNTTIKLIKREPATPKPLASVKQTIFQRLEKKKYNTLRSEYLSQLKAKVPISVNKRAWESLQKELGEKR